MKRVAPNDTPGLASADAWVSPASVHTLAMLALTVVALYLCLRMTQPFMSALAWALALAVLAMPLQRWLESRVRSVNFAAALSVLAAAVIVVVPVILVTTSMVDEAIGAVRNIQSQIGTGEWRKVIAAHPRLAVLVSWIDREFDLPGSVSAAAGMASDLASRIVRGSLRQIVELLLTFYLLFYFLRDRRKALSAFTYLSPLSAAQMARLYRHVDDTLHATMYGTFVVALVQGALGGVMFWALNLPAPLLWGVVMGLLAIVPVLGAFLIWIPAALFLLLTGHPIQALVLALWGGIVIGGIDNLLYPMLVGSRLHTHTVLVFISIVGGLFVFGAAGLILGPVILTSTMVLLEAWRYPEGAVASHAPAATEAGANASVAKA
jgi:predicted PurR-regulated permease PerM